MKPADCCLTVVFPKALEENMIDLVLSHPDLASGFTTFDVEGHGQGAVYRSANEQVRGRARRMKLEMVMNGEDARKMVADMKQALPNPEIAYWIQPVNEFGRFA
jgi:predicted outer membrane protein